MDQIHQVLHCPGNLYSLIQSVSAFKKFRSAHSKFNRETRPHRFADRGQDLAGKPYPVFETSSILIRAMIKVWRQKLVDQPSMSAVNHNHFITAEFRQLRRVIVCFNNISNLRFCQWSHRKSVRSCPGAGAVLSHTFLLVFIQKISPRILSRMGELHAGHSPVSLDRVRRISKAGDRSHGLCIQMICMRRVRGRMHHQLTDRHRGRSAFCPQFIKRGRFGTDRTLRRDLRPAHRRGKHTVAECYVPDRNRLTQIRILSYHIHSPFLILPASDTRRPNSTSSPFSSSSRSLYIVRRISPFSCTVSSRSVSALLPSGVHRFMTLFCVNMIIGFRAQ